MISHYSIAEPALLTPDGVSLPLTVIRETLLFEWDPLGVSDIPEATDEYEVYADTVLSILLHQKSSAEDIPRYLYEVATEQMGLSYPELAERCDNAARAVAASRPNL